VGVKFDNTKASSKPYFDCLKELKRRDVVIYGENIFRYGILIDPNITINNSRVRTWFLDIEIDNFSQDTELTMQQVVDNALSKLLSITIYDTLAKRYVALIVDPVGSITEQRTKDTDKIILIFKTEKSMLNYFVKLLKESQPYIISGWYSNEFDIPFLINKVKNEFND
jgi:DNA polymerase-2